VISRDVGLGFKLVSSKAVDLSIHWIEWIDQASFAAGSLLQAASASHYNLGAYDPGTDKKVYLNPLTAGTSATTTLHSMFALENPASYAREGDPMAAIPGSIGNILYDTQGVYGNYKPAAATANLDSEIFRVF
jgi:hypothetical protein